MRGSVWFFCSPFESDDDCMDCEASQRTNAVADSYERAADDYNNSNRKLGGLNPSP